MTPTLLMLVSAAFFGFTMGFLVALRYGRRHDRIVALRLINEAARHKGGKISPHITQWAARELGLVN